ncbi:MAG TPA: carbohydrate ABC transporter permease [Methylomirabilota bacterium]|jgi:ABC-type glycerol-3-phosphate transport system permease component|nr:carbohydrate ABC transporter permease [Methylomirabilota bacterium]
MTSPVRRGSAGTVAYVALALALVVWAAPVLWTVVTSFKPHRDIFTLPPTFVFQPTLEHYRRALGLGGGRFVESSEGGILPGIWNSLAIATATTGVSLLVAIPAGYAYARLRFRGRRPLAFYALFTQMAPPIGLLIPYFYFLNRAGLMDTHAGLIAVYLTFSIPFGVWLMITYFEELPRELEEAAAVDGAGRLATLVRIVLPQARGGVAVTAIFSFINAWNEFLFAAVLTGNNTRTAPVALFGYVSTEEHLWGPFTASGVMIMVPVVLIALLAQRQIVRGLTLGAVARIGR